MIQMLLLTMLCNLIILILSIWKRSKIGQRCIAHTHIVQIMLVLTLEGTMRSMDIYPQMNI